jgi:UDP-N-acetylglucosamine transferase subunit ALG13
MIVVTVGSSVIPFDRLIDAVGTLPPDRRLVVQTGPSHVRPAAAECVEFMPFEQLVAYVREADVVVTHAGVGSTMLALTNGKRPILVPRLPRLGEAIDDHQLIFGRRMAAAGLATIVEDVERLPEAVACLTQADPVELREHVPLAAEIDAYIGTAIARRQVSELSAR